LKHMIVKAALVGVLVAASSVVSLSSSGVVLAVSSSSTNSDGNCNNWYPHGWSWTTWSGGVSSDWGTTDAYLSWYNPSTGNYDVKLHTKATAYGATGDAEPDLYYPDYEYGSGGWSEDGYHTASFFSGQRHSAKSIWCG
jgi:hypothetical protein